MSKTVQEAVELLQILPGEEQDLALEIIRRMVLAWDPDFTRLTAAEREELLEARADDDLISHDEINWD